MTDLGTVARAIIDETLFMVLGTADRDGQPWVAPVYFGSTGYVEFYWASSPEVAHSRNIAVRPQVSIVVFDSRQIPGSGLGVYMDALAQQVPDDELDLGLSVYNGRFADPGQHGLRRFEREQVSGAAGYRLYRAVVSGYSMLCPREAGRPCAEHGRAVDHRAEITL